MPSRLASLDPRVVDSALAAVPSSLTPVMIFGSFARGDESATSDVDVLELADRRTRLQVIGRVHVYAYGEAVLRRMAANGALFVLHLRTDGIIVRDAVGTLSDALSSYIAPRTYEPHRQALQVTAKLLDVEGDKYVAAWNAYHETAIFIIRTLVYIRFAERGTPLFSLPRIAEQLRRPDLLAVARLKAATGPSTENFAEVKSLIAELSGERPHNPFGSVEALIASRGDKNPTLVAFGLRVLGRANPKLGYDLLTLFPFG